MMRAITLFLCGDVMTGRGIDQILPHPSPPFLMETYVRDARKYVHLAEEAHGLVPKPADPAYIWGDTLAELDRRRPDVRIVNLETAVTASDDFWPEKEIHYRMNPANVGCLTAARIDCCALANNHVLDWGYAGLAETLATLHRAGIKTAGAGRDRREAEVATVLDVAGKGRVLVIACGSTSSGIPGSWGATGERPGVNLIEGLSERAAERIGALAAAIRRPKDILVVSIHWGGNWGYDVSREERNFAHLLIDTADVDIVHGHSSHHAKGIEVYRGRLILYGCGDFLNDYEGIGGYGQFRDDLGLIYLPRVDPATGELQAVVMMPTRIRNLKVSLAPVQDAVWLRDVLNREGGRFGTSVALKADRSLELQW